MIRPEVFLPTHKTINGEFIMVSELGQHDEFGCSRNEDVLHSIDRCEWDTFLMLEKQAKSYQLDIFYGN